MSIQNCLQTDAAKSGAVLLEALFSPVIALLKSSCVPASRRREGSWLEDSLELQYVQLVFMAFALTQEGRRSEFLAVIVPALCAILLRKQSDCAVVQFIGRGLTHLARSCSEAFRDQIVLLSEQQRTCLQNVMRATIQQQQALEQQQAATVASSTPSGPGLSLKKIDMSRYKATK